MPFRINQNKIIRRAFSASPTHPLQNTAGVENWMKKLSSRATTQEGKINVGQLSSLIGYYNKAAQAGELETPDWSAWESELETDGIVSKIRENYDSLMEESYNNEDIAVKVRDSESAEYRGLNSGLVFHNLIWKCYYWDSLIYYVDLKFMPEFDTMLPQEENDYTRFINTELARKEETQNWIPGATSDVDYYGYICNQFSWGKKVTTYMRHPGDDYKSMRATKNILGR